MCLCVGAYLLRVFRFPSLPVALHRVRFMRLAPALCSLLAHDPLTSFRPVVSRKRRKNCWASNGRRSPSRPTRWTRRRERRRRMPRKARCPTPCSCRPQPLFPLASKHSQALNRFLHCQFPCFQPQDPERALERRAFALFATEAVCAQWPTRGARCVRSFQPHDHESLSPEEFRKVSADRKCLEGFLELVGKRRVLSIRLEICGLFLI